MGLQIKATVGSQQYILYPIEEIPLRIDISTIDNGEIGEVFGDLSQPIQFAGNEDNNLFFQHAFDFGFQDIPGSRTGVPVVVEDEQETLFVGRLLLDSWDAETKTYECTITTGVITLADSLEGQTLADDSAWDLPSINHNMSTIIANQSDQNAQVVFPLVDYGADSDGRPRIPVEEARLTADLNNGSVNNVRVNTLANDAYFNQTQQWQNFWVNNGQLTSIINIVEPTEWHGDISVGDNFQGNISSFSTPLRAEQFCAGVTLRTLVDAIFRQAGATYSAEDSNGNNIFDTMLGDVIALPKTFEGLGQNLEPDLTNAVDIRITNPSGRQDLNPQQSPGTTTYNAPILTPGSSRAFSQGRTPSLPHGSSIATNIASEVDAGNNFSNGVYVAPLPGTYEFEFSLDVSNITTDFRTGSQNVRLAPKWYVNGRQEMIGEVYRITRDNTAEFSVRSTFSYNLNEGDTVWVEWQELTQKGNRDCNGEISNIRFRTSRLPLILSGQPVSFSSIWEDQMTLDALTGIVQKFNLVIVSDKDRVNHYNIFQYYDWILAGNRVDWSDRVQSKSFSPLLSDQEKEIVFSDADGGYHLAQQWLDSGNEYPLGSQVFNSDPDDLSNGSRTIGGYFTPVAEAGVAIVGEGTPTINQGDGIPHIYELDNNGQRQSINAGVLIGYHANASLADTIYIQNDDGSISASDQPEFRTIHSVNQEGNRTLWWSDRGGAQGTYNTYWREYINHLYGLNNQKLTAEILLRPSEFKTLNINDTIHIDGVDYLINRINGFNLSSSDIVTVELISFRNNFTNVFTEPRNRYLQPVDPDLRTFALGINVIGYDGSVVDGIQFDVPVVQQDMFTHTVIGEHSSTSETGSSDTETINFKIRPMDGFEISASNFQSNQATIDGVSGVTFTDDGDDGVDVSVTLTIQNGNVYRLLTIEGEVDRELPGNTDFNLTWNLSSSLTAANVTLQDLGDGRGQIDGVTNLQAVITPPDGQTLDESTFSVQSPLPAGVLGVTFVGFGNSILATARVRFQNVNTTATLNVTGDDPVQLPVGTQTSAVTIDITEMITNVTTISDLTFRGVVGTRDEILIPLYAADGFTLDHDNFSATLTDGTGSVPSFATMYDAIGGGENVQIPISVTWPQTDQTLNVQLNGSAQEIGAETVDLTVNFTGVPANTSLTETTETFTLNPGQSINYTNTLTPNQGYQLGETGLTLTETDPNNVISGLSSNQSKFGANISMTITAGTENRTASIAISGAGAEEEPYQHVINLTESLPNGKLNTTSMSSRFGETDTSVTYSITISPIMDNFSYPSGTTFTVTGGTASNYTYSGGSVTFRLTCALPTFSSTNPIGDVSQDISISAASTPTANVATLGDFSIDQVELARGGGAVTGVGFTANGRVQFSESGSGSSITSISWLAGFTPSYSDNGQTMGKVGHNGAVLSNNTGSNRTGWILMHPAGNTSIILDRVRITQLGADSVGSSNVSTIVVSSSAPTSGTPNSTITFVIP